MPLVTPTEAIRLSGRSKASFYKDVASGKVSKTVQDGKSFFDTSELVRAYGELKKPEAEKNNIPSESFESAISSKDREIELLRRLLDEKDSHIASLKDAMKLLEYRQSQNVQSETTSETAPKAGGFKSWFRR